MDTKGYESKSSVKVSFRKIRSMQKTVASLATVFFIFSGITVPTSFAAAANLPSDAKDQAVPVVSYDPAAPAPSASKSESLPPSGAAVQNPSALSSASTPQVTGTASVNLPLSFNVFASSSPNSTASATLNANGISIHFSNGSMIDSGTGGISYDDPATTGAVETIDLSKAGQLVLGLQGFVHTGTNAAGNSHDNSVWMTLQDAAGHTGSVLLSGVTTAQETVVSVDLGQFTGVDLQHVKSAKFSVDGYNVAGTWLNVHQVPSAWTCAASNSNYALKVELAVDYPQHGFVLKVQNLVTGAVKEVGSAPAAYGEISLFDVSPDGSTVVYYAHTNTAIPGYVAYGEVVRISDPSKSVSISGVLSGIVFENNGAVAVLSFLDKQVRVDTATLQYHISPAFLLVSTPQAMGTAAVNDIPLVPQGWTRAASNANYAFQLDAGDMNLSQQYRTETLKLQDLRTGTIQIIGHGQPLNRGLDFHDVSPDGTTMIYSIAESIRGTYDSPTIYIQKIADPLQKTTIDGEFASIVFNAERTAGLAVNTTYESGTIIQKTTTVRLRDLHVTSTVDAKLVRKGSSFVEYPAEKVLVQIERVASWLGNSYHCYLMVYDTTNGIDHMKLVSEDAFGDGEFITADVKLTSITTYNAQRIVSVAVDAPAAVDRTQYTYIVNVDSGKKLTLNGWAESVTYQGTQAIYNAVHLDDPERYGEKLAVRQVIVNLGTLTVVPAAPTVNATDPTAAGVVTLSGTKAADTSIYYSLDGGVTYKQLVAPGNSTSWSGKITLPVGTSKVLIQARKTVIVSGVSKVLSSETVSRKITYTAPKVAAPTVNATDPTAAGVVTLSGTKAAGTSIYYSLDGGVTYKQLVVPGDSTSWSGNITLPVGTSTVLIQARKTVTVSGVSKVISSAAVSRKITYTAPKTPSLPKPPSPSYRPFVVSGKNNIALPVGISQVLDQAKK